MDSIIAQIKQSLTENGTENVFSVFDAKPVSGKGDFFTTVGVRELEWLAPIYTDSAIYMPFKVIAEIKITAPISCGGDSVFKYFHREIEAGIDKLIGMKSYVRKITLSPDKTLNRLVLAAEMNLSGIREIKREEQDP